MRKITGGAAALAAALVAAMGVGTPASNLPAANAIEQGWKAKSDMAPTPSQQVTSPSSLYAKLSFSPPRFFAQSGCPWPERKAAWARRGAATFTTRRGPCR